MNSLRFRVWDHETSTMIPPSDVCLGFVFIGERPEPKAFLYDSRTGESRPIPLAQIMQSTFRHDRNGNEIFEDDIIATPRGSLVVRRSARKFDMMKQLAIPQEGVFLQFGMRIVMVGNFGPDPQKVLRGLVDESMKAELCEALDQIVRNVGNRTAF
jgi:hypothetical protein